MRDGTLERILRTWNIWNDDQPGLYQQVLAHETIPPTVGSDPAAVVAVGAAPGAQPGQHIEPVRKRGCERGVGRGLYGRKGSGHVCIVM